jgi:flagellar protein FlaG
MDVLTNTNVTHNPDSRTDGLKVAEVVAKSATPVEQKSRHQDVEKEPKKTVELKDSASVVSHINSFLSDANRRVEFSFDKNAGQQVFGVVDKESGDILRQYPSKEMLDIKKRLGQLTGVLVNENA